MIADNGIGMALDDPPAAGDDRDGPGPGEHAGANRAFGGRVQPGLAKGKRNEDPCRMGRTGRENVAMYDGDSPGLSEGREKGVGSDRDSGRVGRRGCHGAIVGKRLLGLPFRQTNDLLHRKEAPITLDFLIPAATYVDERMTIGEVIKVRFTKERAIHEKWLRSLLGSDPGEISSSGKPSALRFLVFLLHDLFQGIHIHGLRQSLSREPSHGAA